MTNIIIMPMKAVLGILSFVERLIVSILNVVLRLCGLQIPKVGPGLPRVSIDPADVLAEINQKIADDSVEKPKLLKPVSDAAHTLYRYALAKNSSERAAIDLSALNLLQQRWLYLLSDADLKRLAAMGLDGCNRVISGKRNAIAGLPAMPESQKDIEVECKPLFASRIKAHRNRSAACLA